MITDLRVGDYIEKSELDTEQKYNDVVEVFEQWGIFDRSEGYEDIYDFTFVDEDKTVDQCHAKNHHLYCKRKLTYAQIMSLKKVDVDNCNIDKMVSGKGSNKEPSRGAVTEALHGDLTFPKKRNPFGDAETSKDECFREDPTAKEMLKAAKAVLAMESLGHEWDEEKGQWFRKEYL